MAIWDIVARVSGYHMVSGYSEDMGRKIWTRTSLLSPLAPIMDRSRVLRLTLGISRSVQGQTVGHASLVPDGGERITVQLHGTKSLPFGLLFELFRIAMSSLK
jgi:hypothetical protein